MTLHPAIGRCARRAGAALGAVALLAAPLAAPPVPAAATPRILSDAQLRARFMLNFLRFTEWPDAAFADAAAPLHVCVLGAADPFGGALQMLQDATAGGRHIHVRDGVAAEQAPDCQLLYVPDAQLRRLAAAHDAIGHRPVLIVGESEAVFEHGGMIAVRAAGGHLAFVVKLSATRPNAINFSPQMLNAAAEVLP